MIILSIKPKYAGMILSGLKRWEFRKSKFPKNERVLLYATAPVKRIVAEIYFSDSIEIGKDDLDIFKEIQHEAGITEAEFLNYFDKKKGYMMRIARINKLLFIDPKKIEWNFKAPQSWKSLPWAFVESYLRLSEV